MCHGEGGVPLAIPPAGKVHLCVIAVCWEEIMLLLACLIDNTMVYYAGFNFSQGKANAENQKKQKRCALDLQDGKELKA